MGSRMSIARTLLLVGGTCLLLSTDARAQIAVVVNGTNPVESLRMAELKRIFLGERLTWVSGRGTSGHINLIDYKGKKEVAEKFYRTVAGISSIRIRMKWLSMILNGEFQNLPVSMDSERKMLDYIATNPFAIGFIHISDFDPSLDSVKVIKVDGKEISDSKYPLQSPEIPAK